MNTAPAAKITTTCDRCDAWAFGPLPRYWVTESVEPVTVTRFAAA